MSSPGDSWTAKTWPANHGLANLPHPSFKSRTATNLSRQVLPDKMPSGFVSALQTAAAVPRSQQLVQLAHRTIPAAPVRATQIDKKAYKNELTRKSVPSIYHGTPHAPTLLERLGGQRPSDVAPNAVVRSYVYHPSPFAGALRGK